MIDSTGAMISPARNRRFHMNFWLTAMWVSVPILAAMITVTVGGPSTVTATIFLITFPFVMLTVEKVNPILIKRMIRRNRDKTLKEG